MAPPQTVFYKITKALQQKYNIFWGKHNNQNYRTAVTVAWKKITTTFPEGDNSQHLVGSVQAVAVNDFSMSVATGHRSSLAALG